MEKPKEHGYARVFDIGERVGVIVKMEMGAKYTGVWARESLDNGTLEHYILMTNEVAKLLALGNNVHLTLEMYL